MGIYEWQGPEEGISTLYAATGFVVETLEKEDADGMTLRAEGTIDTYDYVEGCPADHKWSAKGDRSSGTLRWSVEPRDSFWKTKEGKQLFTLSSDADEGIMRFVGKKLTEFLRLREKLPAGTPAVIDVPMLYNGEMARYEGPCVCELLQNADSSSPFPWAALTGGKFPKRCFECSCGRQWWRYDPAQELWAPVGDPAAWATLTTHNGEDIEPIVEHPVKHEIYALRTVRAEGFIPLG